MRLPLWKMRSLSPGLFASFITLAALVGTAGVIALGWTALAAMELSRATHGSSPAIASLHDVAANAHRMKDIAMSAAVANETAVAGENNAAIRGNATIEFELASSHLEKALASYRRETESAAGSEFARRLERHRAALREWGGLTLSAGASSTSPRKLRELTAELTDISGALDHTLGLASSAEIQAMADMHAEARWRLLQSSIVSATIYVLGVALAIMLGRSMNRSLRHGLRSLDTAAVSLASGKFDARAAKCAHAEIARFTDRFNTMADSIERTHEDAVRAKRRLTDELNQRLELERQLRARSSLDSLTGLQNRQGLVDHLQECIETARQSPAFRFALLYIDLDRFKLINDSLGHLVGDEVLVEVAKRLRESIRSVDSVVRLTEETTARMGGDEFAILLKGIANPGRAVVIAERISEHLSHPFTIESRELRLGASIGVAINEERHQTPEEMLQDADTAMYRAKAAGGHEHAVFDERMREEVRRRLDLENDLHRAAERQEFAIRYQPIVSLATGEVVAFEALLRWRHPTRGEVRPSEFVPVAEETGLIVRIGSWVMQEAARQLSVWRQHLPESAALGMSVNVSPAQLTHSDFSNVVESVLASTGLNPRFLRLEITESMILDGSDSVRNVLLALRERGIAIHLDDFGTGYSSLSSLHMIPLDVLKIDQSFVRNLEFDRDYAAVIRAIMSLASSLRMRVTAEGLETPQQLALVRSLGCDFGQGYLFSPALEPSAAWEMITSKSTQVRAA